MSAITLEIAADGRSHTVTIAPGDAPGLYTIAIDGADPIAIEAVALANGGGPDAAATTWSLRDVVTGIVTTAAVVLGAGGDGEVVAGGHAVSVAIAGRRARRRGQLGAIDGEQRIVAPMPGKVIKVLVKAGDTVTARQPLVVVEAMKMENELTAQRPGTVTEVAIAEGASVDAGRLLVVVV